MYIFFGFCSTLRSWHTWGWLTSVFSQVPFAFKDSVIERFCNWYHLSHFAAFFNEIGSQVIHRDTLWEPSSTVVGRQKIVHFKFFLFLFLQKTKKEIFKKNVFFFFFFFFNHHSGIHSMQHPLFLCLILPFINVWQSSNYFSTKLKLWNLCPSTGRRVSFFVKKKKSQ